MDDELRRLLTLVDHGDDAGAVERWFVAVEESFRDADVEAESWDAFVARFREKAGDFDAGTVGSFLEKADAELGDPLRVVERFSDQVGSGRAADAYAEARASGDAGGDRDDPDWDRFGAFLEEYREYVQAPWDQLQEWLVYQARAEGFGVEIDSFVDYVASSGGDHVAAFYAYGGVTPPEVPDTAANGSDPAGDEPAPAPEKAAANALALARRALDDLRAQFPDTTISMTDERLIAILDREINAASGA